MPNIMGIDVGLSGGLASYDGVELLTYEMPTLDIIKNGKQRRKIDIHAVLRILRNEKPDHVFIEQVNAQPGNGAAHAFAYGYGCGIIEACVAACDLPYTLVSSMKWKKAMQCPKDKDAARSRASQLLPQYAHCWQLKRQDGIAESSLLAFYGWTHGNNIKTGEMK